MKISTTFIVILSLCTTCFAGRWGPHDHEPSANTTFAECVQKAAECDFIFYGHERLGMGYFSVDTPAREVFTPPIIARDPNRHVGAMESYPGQESYECTGSYPNRYCRFREFCTVSPTQGRMLFGVKMAPHTMSSALFHWEYRELSDFVHARGRCFRTSFYSYLVPADSGYPNTRRVQVNHDLEPNNCVMFWYQ